MVLVLLATGTTGTHASDVGVTGVCTWYKSTDSHWRHIQELFIFALKTNMLLVKMQLFWCLYSSYKYLLFSQCTGIRHFKIQKWINLALRLMPPKILFCIPAGTCTASWNTVRADAIGLEADWQPKSVGLLVWGSAAAAWLWQTHWAAH